MRGRDSAEEGGHTMDDVVQLKKDRHCRRCEWIIDCKGKPPGVELCIRFKERKGKKDEERL